MSKIDTDDFPSNLSENERFQSVVDRVVVSRRSVLKAGLGLGAVAFLGGGLAACNGSSDSNSGTPLAPSPDRPDEPRLGFGAVATSTGDAVVVPEGYRADVLAPWGSALFVNSPAWRDDGTNSAADQAMQVGDNHDGMHFFPIDGHSSSEGLLVVNHEYTNLEYLYGADYMENWSEEKVRKAQHAHGQSVLHIKKNDTGRWDVVLNSPYNRRIHGNTPMLLTGPAAGDALLVTDADLTGTMVYGTLNNCGNGFTPWGTYLAAEENFNGYFANGNADNPLHARYGVPTDNVGWGYLWHLHDSRFDASQNPNEPNRFGWVVEIDPFDPTSTPKKRTALGRFKHENIAIALTADNRVVVYSGDDERFEYLYKFVSDRSYDPDDPIANRNLLDSGKLYVARFTDGEASGDFMGAGEWILLDKSENATLAADDRFATQAEVLINTRLAADAVGATPMDRPEWVAVHPQTGEVYCTLTNNSRRTAEQTDDANPRANNNYGQIVRWREDGGDHAATGFAWDLFVIAGNPIAYPDTLLSGSDNINADNTFNSPDGLAFDSSGRLWIQTDGNFSNTGDYQGQGNNQMLAADPVTREIRRFLVGPSGCEITGITFTPDRRTLFVNVQHPGEVGSHPRAPTPPTGTEMDAYVAANPTALSNWPKSQWSDVAGGGRPRSATVVITREDGGVIGS